VKRRVKTWIRRSAGLLAVLVGLSLAAPPAGADQVAQKPIAPKSLKAATTAKLASLNTNEAIALSQIAGAGSSSSSSGFFKTRKGVAALVLMVGGVAWAIASRKQDAVHSPAR
jgi:hypothetical protein